ncbi:MAG: hypothetical protein H6561_16930 [Lewinellaceae bacterium]|nr:hypothetical protein [Lewinellaceae bacterium]
MRSTHHGMRWMFGLTLDDFDNLWIGTANNGVFRFEQKPRFRSYLNATASASSNAPASKQFIEGVGSVTWWKLQKV